MNSCLSGQYLKHPYLLSQPQDQQGKPTCLQNVATLTSSPHQLCFQSSSANIENATSRFDNIAPSSPFQYQNLKENTTVASNNNKKDFEYQKGTPIRQKQDRVPLTNQSNNQQLQTPTSKYQLCFTLKNNQEERQGMNSNNFKNYEDNTEKIFASSRNENNNGLDDQRLKMKYESLLKDKNNLDQEIALLKTNFIHLEEENNKLRFNLDLSNNAGIKLEEKVIEYKNEIGKLQSILKEQHKELEMSFCQNDKSQQIDQFEIQVKELQRQIQIKDQTIDELTNEFSLQINEKMDLISSIQEQFKELRNSQDKKVLKQVQEENRSLQEQLQVQQQKINQYKNKIKKMLEIDNQVEKIIEKLNEENTGLKQRIVQCQQLDEIMNGIKDDIEQVQQMVYEQQNENYDEESKEQICQQILQSLQAILNKIN